MPPKQKIKPSQIFDEAYSLIKEKGKESFNARNLAFRLGCSTQPIFSYYPNMLTLEQEVAKKALEEYRKRVFVSSSKEDPMLTVMINIAKFSSVDSNLFDFLFFGNDAEANLRKDIEENGKAVVLSISNSHSLPLPLANVVYLQNYIFSFGLALMIKNKTLQYNETSTKALLKSQLSSTLLNIKSMSGKPKKK